MGHIEDTAAFFNKTYGDNETARLFENEYPQHHVRNHEAVLPCPSGKGERPSWRRDGIDGPIEIPSPPKTAKRKVGVQQKGTAFTPGPAPKGREE
jgi:hypothetical protein